MLRKWRFRITGILNAIKQIEKFTDGMDYQAFEDDKLTQDAVMWHQSAIGEAVSRVPGAVKNRHPEIPWEEMRSMGNYVIDEYFRIKLDVIWDTVSNNLPPLKPALVNILESEPNC